MRFTVIGHACLYVETSGPSILIDPWLFGSCYWRGWWHFPTNEEPDPRHLSPDLIYLTHHHSDHFHYPSMRRIDRSAEVMVPRFGVDVMAGEVQGLGFERVRELGHGEVQELAPGVRVGSYQYGFDDTLFIVQDGDTVLADLNDCKIRGRALQAAAADFGPVTFMLKTHSWAQSYPLLYDADDPADLELLSPQTYLDDFTGTVRELQPRYAIPFANMVGFLHPEAWEVNRHMITPDDVARAMAEADGVDDTELVTMGPGDSWSDDEGFVRDGETDWWENRLEGMAEAATALAPVFERTAREEAERTLDFDEFRAYLERFLDELPPLVARILLKRPVVFWVPGDDRPYWVIDGRRGRVWRQAHDPPDRATLISIEPGVIADAIDKEILHFIQGSMRIRAHLRPGGADVDLGFWGLMMIWELGYLPLRTMASARFLRAFVARRHEGYDAVSTLVGGSGSPLERLSEGFGTGGEADQERRAG
ncbi:MAG: MBL fold metallo-hydrolase [Actinomycetota bacterium]